ncbi:MAG TPA: hypothetical protein P5340_13380 [Defluviicoccus sp.]|nr:hypothetical protein [Defluviicoccus sp.]
MSMIADGGVAGNTIIGGKKTAAAGVSASRIPMLYKMKSSAE